MRLPSPAAALCIADGPAMLPLPAVAAGPGSPEGRVAAAGRSVFMAALAAVVEASPKKSVAAVAGGRQKPALTLGDLDDQQDAERGQGCALAEEGSDPEHEEAGEKRFAGWALLRSALGFRHGDAKEPIPETPGAAARGRAFDLAGSIEAGLANENSTDFSTPLRRSSRLWRFRLLRAADRLSARLVAEDGEFLMYAQVFVETRTVGFFLYDPTREEDRSMLDTSAPAFTLSYNEARTEWHLAAERCQHCQLSPTHLSCGSAGKQQLAHIRHTRCQIGDGISNVMEMRIPGIYSDGRALVWCAAQGRGDLGRVGEEAGLETQLLVTRMPVWTEEVGSLVLDFKGRNILASAKNCQLALRQKQKHTVCQFGKLSDTNFALDFKFPLSTIQAFGAAMSTLFWV